MLAMQFQGGSVLTAEMLGSIPTAEMLVKNKQYEGETV